MTESADGAFSHVLQSAGATLPCRDSVDQRIIGETRAGTGRIVNSQREVGGWPALASGEAPPDSDGDGMPDDWEQGRGLNPYDGADAARDPDGDGYTNLEAWLNTIQPAGAEAGASPASRPAATAPLRDPSRQRGGTTPSRSAGR
jgi:hypothetical protein